MTDDQFASVGEVSPEALQELNELLDENSRDDLTEAEAEEVMAKIAEIPGGRSLLQSLREELAAGGGELMSGLLGSLPGDDGEESSASSEFEAALYSAPVSPLRLVYRAEVIGATVAYWRRVSLPSDASFCDLHFALEDAFTHQGKRVAERGGYHFEWREGVRVVATFLPGGGQAREGEDYCAYQNQPMDLFSEGVEQLFYYQQGRKEPFLSVRMEKLIERNGFESLDSVLPDCLAGEGPTPGFDGSGLVFRQPGRVTG